MLLNHHVLLICILSEVPRRRGNISAELSPLVSLFQLPLLLHYLISYGQRAAADLHRSYSFYSQIEGSRMFCLIYGQFADVCLKNLREVMSC